jgi:DNA-binding protein YbaB
MYVARLNKVSRYRDNRYASSQIEEYYHKMKIGQSIPHFEQVVAYSAENGVVISELAKGKSIDEIGVSIYEQITNEQIEEILESLVLAAHNGVVIDEHPNNIFYDPTVGFTIIDFKRKEDVMPSERPVELQIAKFLFQLLSLDISSTSLVDKETPQYILEDEQLCLNFCKRMVEVVLHLDTTHGINSDLQRQILSILNSKMQHIEENILDIERNIEKI